MHEAQVIDELHPIYARFIPRVRSLVALGSVERHEDHCVVDSVEAAQAL